MTEPDIELANIEPASQSCITCGTLLTGPFCSQCGEKKLNPAKDYSLMKFMEQTVDAFSHFDSKFLRSFKALLLKPGFLTAEFVRGRRTPYMKPVQIFIVATILFYFFYPRASTFFASVHDFKNKNIFRYDVNESLESRAATEGSSVAVVINEVHREAAHKSKAFLFVIIPFWGLFFYLLFRRSTNYLVPQVVFAVHSLSFFVVLYMIYIAGFILFQHANIGDRELVPFLAIFALYLIIGIKRVYQQSIFHSILKAIVLLFTFIALFVIYRQAITLWALISQG
jgi:hypothetical protein